MASGRGLLGAVNSLHIKIRFHPLIIDFKAFFEGPSCAGDLLVSLGGSKVIIHYLTSDIKAMWSALLFGVFIGLMGQVHGSGCTILNGVSRCCCYSSILTINGVCSCSNGDVSPFAGIATTLIRG